MKARLLLALRTAEPQVATVQTWQPVGDEQMLRVNAELGFRPHRRWYDYEAPVSAVIESRRTA
jgi:hypothetical protein